MTHKKWLSWLFKCALTTGGFYLALRQVSWTDIASALTTQQKPYLIIAFLAICTQILLGGVRWHLLLRILTPEKPPIYLSIRTYFASAFFSIYVPGTLGSDTSRILMLRAQGGSTPHIIASVFFDRIGSMVSVILLVLCFLPKTFAYLSWNSSYAIGISITGFIISALSLWLLKASSSTIINLPRLVKLRTIIQPMTILFQHPFAICASLLVGVCAHIAYCLCIYMLAMSLSIPLSVTACLTLIPFIMLLTSLPISISGWGIREVGMTGALALASVTATNAVLISVQAGLLATLVCLIGGIIYLTNKKSRLNKRADN
jgi:uncharacterized membrane protein YbhN (UPF0104 family)